MPHRLANRLRFLLERLILRGARYRLLVIAVFIGVLALGAGLLAYAFAGGFATPAEAIWWAFLRMTDPGYLGDDEGLLLRAISTALTVTGFVLFVGALIAILTQWLNQTIAALEGGHTPVALRGHVVILGWTNRTVAVVQELVLSEGRLQRFLLRHGSRGLRIAILADGEPAPRLRELRERLGSRWDERQVILRSGTPLRLEHLRRVDFLNAAAVLLPGADFDDEDAGADTQLIKTLLSMANHPTVRQRGNEEGRPVLPLVVAEVADANKVSIARRAYSGPIELLTSDAIISRLIAQNVRHCGLSHVYDELLTHGHGNELYVRECPSFVGRPVHALHKAFPHALLLGITRPHGDSFLSLLNPASDVTVEAGDRLVLLAREYEDAAPTTDSALSPIEFGATPLPPTEASRERRVLLLGWNHRVPALLRELDSYHGESFRVDLLSLVPTAERERYMARYGVRLERVALTHIEGDYNAPPDLQRVAPETYDHIVLLGSDWLESGAEADARTILGHLLLRETLPEDSDPAGAGQAVEIVIELLDMGNRPLFRHRATEVLISPLILSHMIAQVALRPELRIVFDELFGPGGPEIAFVPPAHLGCDGESVRFRDLQLRAFERGAIALGVRLGRDGAGPAPLQLNPLPHTSWTFGPKDRVVLLTTT
jgi:hypothetical protein